MKKFLKNIQWSIFIICIILLGIGIFAQKSASVTTNFTKHLTWISISIPVCIIFAFINYKILVKFSWLFYIISLILLGAVLLTQSVNGASSWFSIGGFSIQPGEFAKISTILFVAFIIDKIYEKEKGAINKIRYLAIVLIAVMIPVSLIILQPDYGTAMAYIFAIVFILFTTGIDKKYIIVAAILIVTLLPILYFLVLPEHAKQRINVYLNPNIDPRGSGYNIIQSKLAIGAGKLFGLGWKNGTQTQLGFLYPKTTDFIFSVIGEEMGFIYTAFIVCLYVVLLTKSIQIAKKSKEKQGAIVAIGITGVLFFHVLENIGMTIGILPITGIPLPFISYGGSSLLTNMICIGILLNISKDRKRMI